MDRPAYSTIDFTKDVGPVPAGKEVKLSVRNLAVSFSTDKGRVRAVRGVSFDLYKGETLCIVGESGSGKSVTSKAIMGILSNNAHVDSGSIDYEGEDLTKVSEEEFHRIRGSKIGMIFQDPLSSLNPIMRIGKQITEVMILNGDHLRHKFDEIINDELIKVKNEERLLEIAKDDLRFEKKHHKGILKTALTAVDVSYKAAVANLENPLAEIESEESLLSQKHKQDLETAKRRNAPSDDIRKIDADFAAANAILVNKHDALAKSLEQPLSDLERKHQADIVAAKAAAAKTIADAKTDLAKKKAEIEPVIAADRKELAAKKKLASAEVKKLHATLFADHKKRRSALIASFLKHRSVKRFYHEFVKEHRGYISKLRVTRKEAKAQALKVMAEVGIPAPEKRFNQYPFEFSGGMRQRIVIAIALTANPDILICDEPTTALDVTIQAQILELINRLKEAHHMSVIFITHDLGVVANMADRVAVMYAGKIVEYGSANEVFYHPAHPYTWALLSSIPDIDSKERLEAIPGTPPNMIYPPKGDAFALRSKYAMGIDFREIPPMYEISPSHFASTWLLDSRAPEAVMPKIVSTRIANSLRKAGVKDV